MPEGALVIETLSNSGAEPRIFRLRGPLTIGNMFEFQSKLREGGPQATIVDLAEVPYVDSAGIGVLVNAYVSCANAKKRFMLAGVSERVKAVLKITRVDQLFTFYPTLADAQAQ